MLQRFRAVFGRHSGFYAPLMLPFKVVTVMEAVMRSNKGPEMDRILRKSSFGVLQPFGHVCSRRVLPFCGPADSKPIQKRPQFDQDKPQNNEWAIQSGVRNNGNYLSR